MQNGSSASSAPGAPVIPPQACTACGTVNTDWARFCARCGYELPIPQAAAWAEAAHIVYLLAQLEGWKSRRLLTPTAQTQLQAEYAERQRFLLAEAQAPPATAPRPSRLDTTASPAPIVPPLPAMAATTVSPGVMTNAPIGAGRQATVPGAPPALSGPTPQNVPPMPPVPPLPVGTGLRVFFQDHALKIIFAVAMVLVLVALRSMMTWQAVGAIVIPAVPLGLTVLFWIFGQKTRVENPWAAFIYHSLVAALLGFDLFAVNKYWLGSLLPLQPALLLAGAAATAVAGGMLARWREIPYLHLLQTGVLTTLYMALVLLKPLLGAPGDFRPTPLLLFGGAYLMVAAGCLLAARSARRWRSGPSAGAAAPSACQGQSADWALAWTLWAHLSVTAFLALSALDVALRGHFQVDDLAPLALLAGLIYTAGAQFLEDPRMVYVSGGFLLVSGSLWRFSAFRPRCDDFGFLLLAVGAMALVMAAYNGRRVRLGIGPIGLAEAYRRVAQIGVGAATLLIWCHVALALSVPSTPYAIHAAANGCLLAALCGGYYLVFARWERRAAFLYGAVSTWGVALVSVLAWGRAPTGAYALTLMLYGAGLCILSTLGATASQTSTAPGSGVTSTLQTVSGDANWRTPLANAGQVAAAMGALLAAALPIDGLAATWAWTLATLLLGGALYAATARQTRSPAAAYASLICTAYASALLMWRLRPFPLTLADCLAPFALATALGTLAAGYRLPTGGQDAPPASGWALWRTPLAIMALLAVFLSLDERLLGILDGTQAPHPVLSLLPSLLAAACVSASRRETGLDLLRTCALAALNLTAILEVAALTDLTQSMAQWTSCGVGLVLLGWSWWLLGRLLARRLSRDVWSEGLATNGLVTAFLAALMVLSAALFAPSRSGQICLITECVQAGAFALICLDVYRTKRAAWLWPSLAIVGIAGVTWLLGAMPGVWPLATAWTLFVLGAAGSYVLLARRLDDPVAARMSLVPLIGGYLLYVAGHTALRMARLDIYLADMLWIVGGPVMALAYGKTARWSGRDEFSYAAALVLTGTYLRVVTLVWHPQPQWHALILLPFLIALYVAGTRFPATEDALLGVPLRHTALAVSGLALLWSAGNGDRLILPWDGATTPPAAPWLVTMTLAAYGMAYALLAWIQRTPNTVAAGAVTLTAAYLHALLTHTTLFQGGSGSAPFTWPQFAFWAVQAGVLWLTLGWSLLHRLQRKDLAAPLLILTGGIALFSAILGLLAVQTPGQGMWTILTLGWAGALWFGLWLLEQGEICLHVGVWNLLAAWGLLVYDRVGADFGMLDLYLLPVGLYLVGIGHRAGSRRKLEEAHMLWWAGLLLILSPAFLAYRQHTESGHTLLFLAECLVALLWGIGQRIRAFVCASLAFIAAFAASTLLGYLPGIGGTLATLLTGVGLFIAGFYALTHRDVIQRWALSIEQQWQAWQGWR